MRAFVLYAVLVGVPIAGTSLIVERGRNRPAPPAVWGAWTIDAERAVSRPGCSSDAETLTIGQSGDSLTIAVGDSVDTLVGRLSWGTSNRPTIVTLPHQRQATRADGDLVAVQATVNRASPPWTMDGTITTIVCGDVNARGFHATWRPGIPSTAGRH